MPSIEVRTVTAAEVQPLRTAILGPSHPAIDDARTRHVAAFQDEQLIAVASIGPEPMPGDTSTAWRLDGIAVDHGFRGLGVGAQVTERCLDHVAGDDGALIWARIPAGTSGFFERWGFARTGSPSTGPAGPEYLVYLRLGPVRRSWSLDDPSLADA